jgi:hypothetical protein
MKTTNLLIAALLLAGLSGVVWWVKKHPQSADSSTSPSTTTKLLDVPDAQLVSLDIQKKDMPPVVLSRAGGKWTITAPENYRADQDAVSSLISSLSPVTADNVVDAKPANLNEYGLTNPVLTVTVHEKNGKTDHLYFGDDVPIGSLAYARVNTDPKVYAVAQSVRTSFSKDVNDLRDKRLLTFDSTQASRIELSSAKGPIEFGKVNQTDWQIIKPGTYRADSFQIEELLRKLSDAKMDLSNTTDAAKAYATAKPAGIAKVTDASGVETLDIRQNKDDYYAKSSQVPGEFKISSDLGKEIEKPLDDFRNKKLFDFGFSDTNRIDLQQGATTRTFVRSGTDWKSNNQLMDAGSVQSLIDKLRDVAATKFAETGFTTPVATITVVSNDGKRTEKVEFAKTADGYLARREGQTALYVLDPKSVNDILEAGTTIKATAPGPKK